MKRFWQRLILVLIILSCGIIFSLDSSARDGAARGAEGGVRDDKAEPAAAAARKVVVYYAQDRHGPW